MALNKRFFTSLARDFLMARPDAPQEAVEMAVWEQMVRLTANALAAQNAMFNYGRFYEACGMPQEVVDVAQGR